ncbi:MAG: zinc-dependent metalloprotease [Oligoflexia bacterium]|nr:zinc-dependent metalloprotease [Oligoflexia bacterium]
MPTFRFAGSAVVLASIASFGALFGGCTPKITTLHRPGIDSAPEVRAPDAIGAAFLPMPKAIGTASPVSSAGNRFDIAIRKDALEKEFLLHGSLIPQTGMTTSHGLQARVVAFRRVGDRLFLLEATQGHVVARELPATLILAEIPILSETDDAIVMDFNAGMSQAFVAGNWKGSASETSAKPVYEDNRSILKIRHSFLDSVKTVSVRGTDTLEIHQIAQVEGVGATEGLDEEMTGAPTASTIALRYYLSPYRPNPSYAPKGASDFRHVGYFEIATQLEESTGRPLPRISRWDISQPVTYYVSANTPAEYVDAVKEGILYWNRAFGREVLRAEVAPAGVTAPDPRYNIVQWVPNDTAGFAYADGLMDPRTGEILHAQVYLTSVFGASPRAKMPGVLRKLREQGSRADARSRGGSTALASARLCDHEAGEQIARGFEQLATMGTDDAAFLRAVQDYIREVAAHEVGHTLGLRHNFAGSLAQNISLAERDRLLLSYLTQDETPPLDKVFTSSFMEYSALPEGVLSAAQVKNLGAVFEHDRLAIRWAYADEEIDPATAPLFCTDGHAAMDYKDCVRFDSGGKPLIANQQKLRAALKSLPQNFAENFIRAKTAPDARDRTPFSRTVIRPTEYLTAIDEALTDQIAWLSAVPPKSIATERKFAYVSGFNAEEVLAATRTSISEQVKALGGAEAALFEILPASDRPAPRLAETASAALAAYLARSDVREGVGYDGKPYVLSTEEIEFLLASGGKLFAQLESSVIDLALTKLEGAKLGSPQLGFELEAELGATVKAILLGAKGDTAPAAFMEFRYPRALRLKAAKLLARSMGGEILDWSSATRAECASQLKTLIEGITANAELTRAQAQWKAEQEELLQLVQASANR